MPYTTDNRWSAGSSGATVPEDAPAAYSARWIDQGDMIPADVVPDRQGFAYDEPADRDRLIALMSQGEGTAIRTPYKANFLDRDVTTVVMNTPEWKCYVRRAGGYIYVDAWLTPVHDMTCGTCGRTWNSTETPTPAARCPFEYDHEDYPVFEDDPEPVVIEVPMVLTEMPERSWRVVCMDDVVRHKGTFESLVKAREWADTGHVCAKAHTYHEVWS